MSFAKVTERVHTFGKDGSLVGIVSVPRDPRAAAAAAQRPFVVVLNAGLVHRVGPFGLGVQLARRAAARGFRVLRFDQSGLGDSAPRPGSLSMEEQVVLDGREAFDSLSKTYGADRFVVGGLCSGALNAHRITVSDERVVGMWMLDGYAYATAVHYRERLLRRLQRPETWIPTARRVANELRGRFSRWRQGQAEAEQAADQRVDQFFSDWPPRASVRQDLNGLLRRGVRMLFVYTGGWSSYVHERQFGEMFPGLQSSEKQTSSGRNSLITVRYHADADHTYVALTDREKMLADIDAFLDAFDVAAAVMATSADP